MTTAIYYFVPSENVANEREGKLNLDVLKTHNLDYAFAGRHFIPSDTIFLRTPGPTGEMGTLLYPKPVGKREIPTCQYVPSKQQWFEADGFWIGVEDYEPFTIRSKYFGKRGQSPGFLVSDQYEDQWSVPIISPGSSTIPMEYSFDFKGGFEMQARAKDQSLWELSGRVQDYFQDGEGMSEEEVARAVIDFLGVNYYFSVAELALMKHFGRTILETAFVAGVIYSATNQILAADEQKKSETTERMNSDRGQLDYTPTT